MAIEYAILGFLSWQPLSGYDLKKLFADSATFHWSGNNNQIYRTLVALHHDGLVTSEVQQEHLPARKVYTITEEGRSRLRAWALSQPGVPVLRNSFLVQLAWAGDLEPDELDGLLGQYEYEVQMQLLMLREQRRRGQGETGPARSPREAYLWRMISQRHISFYESELAWVRELRAGLGKQANSILTSGVNQEGAGE